MKKLRYEARGVTAAVIESKIAPSGVAALDELLIKAEDAFVARAEEHALSRREEMMKMTAAERRRAPCERLTLTQNVERDGDTVSVTLTATSLSGGDPRSRTATFFWDAKNSLASKTAPKRRRPRPKRKKTEF